MVLQKDAANNINGNYKENGSKKILKRKIRKKFEFLGDI